MADFIVTEIPYETKTGLALFAAAWVERFTVGGGALVANHEGKLVSFIPSAGVGSRANQYGYHAAHRDGAFSELTDLLAAMEGGRAAVWKHIRQSSEYGQAGCLATFPSMPV